MTKEKTIFQLKNLREHCKDMSNTSCIFAKDVVALDDALKELKASDRNKMIIEDIKRIIKRYDDMNLTVSFEDRRENHIKAYMEIKDYFNNYKGE